LASPYTDPDKAVEAGRYEAVLAAWRWLLENRTSFHYYVPIVQSHQLCVGGRGLPGDWTFWAEFDGTMIGKCNEFWVLCIAGFKKSVGITAERKLAAGLGLPIRFLVPDGDGFNVSEHEPQ
jgi:hypothetical protein